MWLECLIKREGPTTVELGKSRYVFQPIRRPGYKKGDFTTSMCEVNSEEHLEYLLGRKTQFREYVEGAPLPDYMRDPISLAGFAIIPHQEGGFQGYRVEDIRGKQKKYAGSDGVWKTDTKGLIPFNTEVIAYTWLKEEAEFARDSGDEAPKPLETGKKGAKLTATDMEAGKA